MVKKTNVDFVFEAVVEKQVKKPDLTTTKMSPGPLLTKGKI